MLTLAALPLATVDIWRVNLSHLARSLSVLQINKGKTVKEHPGDKYNQKQKIKI